MQEEIWKTIKDFEDYQMSNFGRVKSFKRYHRTDERILKNCKYEIGYEYIGLYDKNNNKHKNIKIHVLMYETFYNYKLKKNECIHHIDKNKINNILENFQLMTKSEHSKLHHKDNWVGSNNPNFGVNKRIGKNATFYGKHHTKESKKLLSVARIKISDKVIIDIRVHLNEGILSQKVISKKFGVSEMTVSRIKNNGLLRYKNGY